ncbi:MAG: PcsB-like coiled-coil domain-containing protein, partial [Minisyncoccales bacterium]
MVKSLGIQISETEKSIEKTSEKIEQKREQISSILRAIYEEDQKSFFEVLLLEKSISNFFDSLNQLEALYSENQKLLNEIKDLKYFLEEEKNSLEEDKEAIEKLLAIQSLQKKESEEIKKEKDLLLEKTKGKESEYQKLLAEKQKRAAEIRSRIFELMGVPKAPTFGEAYEIAKYVESLTGVRPAFLLAVLYQESRIGQNVGQCYLKNISTGEGVKVNSGQKVLRVMNPTRDVPPFLTITKELGRDPFNTLVSCPMTFGWGGAMGPAQFLPSTWMRYKERISAVIKKTPDPWEIKDSFLAAALY